ETWPWRRGRGLLRPCLPRSGRVRIPNRRFPIRTRPVLAVPSAATDGGGSASARTIPRPGLPRPVLSEGQAHGEDDEDGRDDHIEDLPHLGPGQIAGETTGAAADAEEPGGRTEHRADRERSDAAGALLVREVAEHDDRVEVDARVEERQRQCGEDDGLEAALMRVRLQSGGLA